MICRIWHGWTTEANADAYERLLRSEVIVGILRREIPGFRAIDLLGRSMPDGAEFVTLMWFDSIEAVQSFAGPDHEWPLSHRRHESSWLAPINGRRITRWSSGSPYSGTPDGFEEAGND